MLILVVILAGLISFLCSNWLIKKTDKFGLIDVPNVRSSHDKPTPKGGGIGICLGVLISFGICWGIRLIDIDVRYFMIMGGAFCIALMGFFSDRFHISALLRMLFQTVIAVIIVWFMVKTSSLKIAGFDIDFGYFGIFAAVLWLVAITNFYNFMDGIDGLASMQGIVAGISIALFGIILKERSLIYIGLILSGATSGFLILNISPARIFMGDVGSYFLGFVIASFCLIDERLLVPIAIVLGVFIFDTIVTLMRRIINNERWYQAHRSHFYQRAVSLGYSHSQVTAVLSMVFLSLSFLACVYLRGSAFIQVAVIIMGFLELTLLALWVVYKEKYKESKHYVE